MFNSYPCVTQRDALYEKNFGNTEPSGCGHKKENTCADNMLVFIPLNVGRGRGFRTSRIPIIFFYYMRKPSLQDQE